MPPPPKEKISEDDLETLRAWIAAGGSLEGVEEAAGIAKNNEELKKSEDRPIKPAEREYWAFKAPVRATVPAPKTPGWNANPIDAFLASAMEAKGVKPSAPADRRTLIRRAYLDVLGLPPTPSKRSKRSSTTRRRTRGRRSSTGCSRRRTTASAGRATGWISSATRTPSGFEFDNDRAQMYRYRDYLVQSFNSDKPYDQFVKEQLAGDEYAPASRRRDDRDRLPAARARRAAEPAGCARRSVSTTSLTFMGLTVGCARCHNHKFDPIPQKDYYRMQSVFFSTQRGRAIRSRPRREVEANRRETQRIETLQRPLRDAKRKIEAPYHAA